MSDMPYTKTCNQRDCISNISVYWSDYEDSHWNKQQRLVSQWAHSTVSLLYVNHSRIMLSWGKAASCSISRCDWGVQRFSRANWSDCVKVTGHTIHTHNDSVPQSLWNSRQDRGKVCAWLLFTVLEYYLDLSFFILLELGSN